MTNHNAPNHGVQNTFALAKKGQRANLAQYGKSHQAISDDCGESINDKFDLVLCNPPFHIGFGMDGSLTVRFVNKAAQRLKKGGKAYFVVNQFLALEAIAEKRFTTVTKLSNGLGFDTFELVL